MDWPPNLHLDWWTHWRVYPKHYNTSHEVVMCREDATMLASSTPSTLLSPVNCLVVGRYKCVWVNSSLLEPLIF